MLLLLCACGCAVDCAMLTLALVQLSPIFASRASTSITLSRLECRELVSDCTVVFSFDQIVTASQKLYARYVDHQCVCIVALLGVLLAIVH